MCAAYPCTPADLASCPKPPGALPAADQAPQFITITWDDAVNPLSYDIIQQITGGFTQRNGCPVPSTYFISALNTIPAAVQALYLSGNEIATHTMTHVGYPPADEIVGCRDWLVNATGIPETKITGFRHAWAGRCGPGRGGVGTLPAARKGLGRAADRCRCRVPSRNPAAIHACRALHPPLLPPQGALPAQQL